ncbi:hypothetical protein BDF19DRAFT_450835 [Syncephalis fuscata]|nr:hypothetical protein BDF19DRAFT_450835 [Syncephalis fuscata]
MAFHCAVHLTTTTTAMRSSLARVVTPCLHGTAVRFVSTLRFNRDHSRNYTTRSRTAINADKALSRLLIYTGAFSHTLKAYKASASMFGLCAIIAVPTIFVYGHDPYMTATVAGLSALMPISLIHYMTGPYVTRIYLQMPKDQPNIKPIKLVDDTRPIDYTLVLETLNIFGGRREHPMPVSELCFLSKPSKLRYLNWTQTTTTNAAAVAAASASSSSSTSSNTKERHRPKGFFVEPVMTEQPASSVFNRVYERIRQQSALQFTTATHC